MNQAALEIGFKHSISNTTSRFTNMRQTLLPPLKLYRNILRAHRELPELQRALGNEYVKNEFRLHKDIENPLHIVGFLASWQDYLSLINNGAWQTGSLSRETFEKMSTDQVVQLYELMKESERIKNGIVGGSETTKDTNTKIETRTERKN
ncbi:Sdh7p PWA37_002806 [Arxiozyma heterogenica]|uniref:Succinate dehydrogenase assembly factor 3 n=1 Tax=Arxiozyma heterogenica TaxID=278026 RepID=A0AAN7ZXQ9_9SACH|nr:hypothetical protein RI543_003518 [Kazachstania heterogenica]